VVDNGIRAIFMRADGPREVHISLLRARNGVWCLRIRDTGCGLDASEMPNWAILGVNDGVTRPVDDVSPAFPDGNLHFWGVGGKCAALRLAADGGRVCVVSRKPQAGKAKDVSVLLLSRQECLARQEQEKRHAQAGEQREQLSPFDMPGGEREPTAEERGEIGATGGGQWSGAGTLVMNEGVHHTLVERLTQTPGGMDWLRRQLKMTYFAYIQHHTPQQDFSPPPAAAAAGAAAAPAAKKRKADKGKGKAAEAPQAAHAAPVRIVVGGVDLREVTDDLMSRMLLSGQTGDEDCFEVGICLKFAGRQEYSSQARLKLVYFPFRDGHASKPAELADEYGVGAGHVIKLRSARMLHNNGKPATQKVPMLDVAYSRDTAAMAAKARALGAPVLKRIAGFLYLGWTWEPTQHKADLRPDAAHARVLDALFGETASSEEKLRGTEFGDAEVSMILRHKLADGSYVTTEWAPWEAREFRSRLLDWAAWAHTLDREAGPFAPPGDFPCVIMSGGNDAVREALGHTADGALLTAWHGMTLALGAAAGAAAAGGAGPSGAAPSTMRLVTNGAAPVYVKLTPRCLVTARHGPGKSKADLFKVVLFVTAGGPDAKDLQAETAVAVLNPWNVEDVESAQLKFIAVEPMDVNGSGVRARVAELLLKCASLPASRATPHALAPHTPAVRHAAPPWCATWRSCKAQSSSRRRSGTPQWPPQSLRCHAASPAHRSSIPRARPRRTSWPPTPCCRTLRRCRPSGASASLQRRTSTSSRARRRPKRGLSTRMPS
jgi:hypothetical protein